MSKQEAIEYVRNHEDDDILDRAELEAASEALGFGKATEEDSDCDLWSQICGDVLQPR